MTAEDICRQYGVDPDEKLVSITYANNRKSKARYYNMFLKRRRCNNRKQRKLKYIRSKNRIRAGEVVYNTIKVSNEIANDKTEFVILVYEEFPFMVKQLKSYWRLNFMPTGWELSTECCDWSLNTKTLKVSFQYFPGP